MADFTLLNIWSKLFKKQQKVPISAVLHPAKLGDNEKLILKTLGVYVNDLSKLVNDAQKVNYDRLSIYRECFTGETEIELLNGKKVQIKEIADNIHNYVGKSVYSINPTTLAFEPDKIVDCWLTKKYAKVVRVWLDNGKYADCTPNHQFMLRNGKYVEAKDLLPGDSLMPLYKKQMKGNMGGYELIYRPDKNKFSPTHWMVARFIYGFNKKKWGTIIHHIDFCKTNNDPTNLKLMERDEHNKMHAHRKPLGFGAKISKIKKGHVVTEETRLKIGEGNKGKILSVEAKAKISKALKGKAKPPRTAEHNLKLAKAFNKFGNILTEDFLIECINKQFKTEQIANIVGCDSTTVNMYMRKFGLRKRQELKKLSPQFVLNHKVLKIEELSEVRDTYDIQTERNHNFALSIGVFVHNCERAIQHPMINGALDLYASFATNFDRVNNATIWVVSDNDKYRNILTEFLNNIGIEEKIYDYTYAVAEFGDFFIQPKGIPGVGIVSIDDSEHPLNISRVDKDGVLIGFYPTPIGAVGQSRKLLPPYEYIHFKVLGAKVRRPLYGEPSTNEFRTISLLSPDVRRLSSNYGMSLLCNAIPVYKRMRLVEDSIMMARLSKGVLRNIIKVMVDGNNSEAVQSIIDSYKTVLKRSVAMNTGSSPNFQDNLDFPDVVTDIILPVWGNVNNVTIDKVGGEVDIKWIADLDELKRQLSTALGVPLTLLAGYSDQTPSGFGNSPAELIDVRFARSARRLQRAMIEGIRRLCQLHLAYLGMDPDLSLFDIQMSDSSTVEEQKAVESLKTTVESMDVLTDYLLKLFGERIDRVWLAEYLNDKFIKLSDFEISKLIENPQDLVVVRKESKDPNGKVKISINEKKLKVLIGSDTKAFVPNKEGKAQWESLYKDAKVKEVERKDK